ncbi:hypothetical protein OUZ56_021887 [Daphnia magna]|uniref:Uncharacterized protein n=1 Tax=Daphnia magna TaxID=35525 RepID=A0ABR0AUT3_9CRUS|nr:hypothetical protein OUZ56_021887 [Daphnia magna]
MDRTNDRYRFETSRPVSTIGIPPTSEYNPRPLQQSGRGGPLPPLMPSLSSDDWINRRTPPPRVGSRRKCVISYMRLVHGWKNIGMWFSKPTQFHPGPFLES